MKHILTEWRTYLAEARDNYFDYNIDKIVLAIESSDPDIDTSYFYYEFADKDDFKNYLTTIGADKVLSNYKIKKLLGHGSIGFAFALEDPHEDYVLKFQISDRTFGADYLKDVYERQQKDQFKPNEVRVLEAFDNKGKINLAKVETCVFVMSKVSMENIAGKTGKSATTDELFKDMENSFAINTLEELVNLKLLNDRPDKDSPDVKKAIDNRMKTLKVNSTMNTIDFYKFVNIFQKGTLEDVAKFFYKVKQDKFQHLSRDQFVFFFKEIYQQFLAALATGRSVDLHAGNLGFRPKSDVPISFDI